MNLEIPKKMQSVVFLAHEVASSMLRPISRKYDTAEHAYPKELDMFEAILNGMEDGGSGMGASGVSRKKNADNEKPSIRNGKNIELVLNMMEMCWGDAGLALSIPGQGLGNAAIATVATPEQKKRFGKKWAAMAITEPEAGSDSANVQTTAHLDGNEWVLNGEKIFVTAADRASLIVVWATLDKKQGKAAIKSFVVEKGTPGCELSRLENKLGIRGSDTGTIILDNCRIPRDNLLGNETVDPKKGFGGVMQTFDNTRPLVAAMSVGVARASLELTLELLKKEGITPKYDRRLFDSSAIEAEIYKMEAELEAARLLLIKAAWMADNGRPNSKEASMAKAKAGRVGNQITLKCVQLCGSLGYNEEHLLEKWARDSKIFDIFEGTQQIQQLIVARRILGKSSKDLK
ncbi:acyl-CoA dehydrogenase family protein [Deltaproteobacteria bacterium TL4]